VALGHPLFHPTAPKQRMNLIPFDRDHLVHWIAITHSGDCDRFGDGGVRAGAAGSSQPRVVSPFAESRGRNAERESAETFYG